MELNLPPYSYKLSKIEEKPYIFDVIRRKFVSLTPEEWVRQHILNYLIVHKNLSKSHIAVERQIKYLNLVKRFDILVFGSQAKAEILIECKAPYVNLSPETAFQIAVYNQQFNANIVIISNGLMHYAWQLDVNLNYVPFNFFEQ